MWDFKIYATALKEVNNVKKKKKFIYVCVCMYVCMYLYIGMKFSNGSIKINK